MPKALKLKLSAVCGSMLPDDSTTADKVVRFTTPTCAAGKVAACVVARCAEVKTNTPAMITTITNPTINLVRVFFMVIASFILDRYWLPPNAPKPVGRAVALTNT